MSFGPISPSAAALARHYGKTPLFVAFVSHAEDNLAPHLAEYESIFLPNQGARRNIKALLAPCAAVYGSTLNPNALLYRAAVDCKITMNAWRSIQEVAGSGWALFHAISGAGVAFSRNLYRWPAKFARGWFCTPRWDWATRAVYRGRNDYPG